MFKDTAWSTEYQCACQGTSFVIEIPDPEVWEEGGGGGLLTLIIQDVWGHGLERRVLVHMWGHVHSCGGRLPPHIRSQPGRFCSRQRLPAIKVSCLQLLHLPCQVHGGMQMGHGQACAFLSNQAIMVDRQVAYKLPRRVHVTLVRTIIWWTYL